MILRTLWMFILAALIASGAGASGLAAASAPTAVDEHPDFSRGFLLGGAIADCSSISIPVILLREGKESPEHEQLLFTWIDSQLVEVAQALASATPEELTHPEVVLPMVNIEQLVTLYRQLRESHHWKNKDAAVEDQLQGLSTLITKILDQQAHGR